MTTAGDPNRTVTGVDEVLTTAELARRPSRPPDYATENRALTTLAEEMATNPRGVLQRCAELVLELCRADSAGIGLLEPGAEGSLFRWHVVVGGLASHVGAGLPLEASPWRTVSERNSVLLFNEAERFFPALRDVKPCTYENLLAPWHSNGQPVGALWAIKHTPKGEFDAEAARLLYSLARFAAAAHRVVAALDEVRTGREELERQVEERTRPLSEAYDSVRASETRFRTALEIETVGVIYLDPEGQIIDANDAFLAMGGYSREDLEAGRLTWQALTPPEWMEASERALAELKATGRTTPYEKEYFRKDSSRWWALFAAKRLPDGTVFEFVLDLTARKEAEDALRASEERFQYCARATRDIIWDIDLVADRVWWSDAMLRQLGYAPEDIGPDTAWCFAHMHPEDRERVVRGMREAAAGTGDTWADEFRYQRADGSYSHIADRGFILRDAQGRAVRMIGAMQDITERKQAEEALRASEERFRQFGEASTDVLWIRDVNTLQWEYLSPAFEAVYGESRERALAGDNLRNWLERIIPEDHHHVQESIKRVQAGERVTFEFRITRPDGQMRWMRDTDFPLLDGGGRVQRIGGIGQDITQHKEAEKTLRAGEERQVFLLKLSDALRPLGNPHEIQREASRVLREHLGGNRVVYWEALSNEEIVPAGADYAADATQFNGIYRLSDYGTDLAVAYRAGHIVSQDDPTLDPHLSDKQRAAFSADRTGGWAGVPLVKVGRFVALLTATFPAPHTWSPAEFALMQEVAERTWAALERARAEMAWRRFAALAEASSEFFGMCDMRLIPFYVNAAGLRLVGLDSLNEAQHTPVLEFFFPEDQALIRDEFLPRVLREGHGEIEIRFRHFKTGEALWVIYSVVALTDEHGKPSGYGTVTRDITERKQAEEALRASESRAKLLLGELQHRVRNTLSVIRSIVRRTAETSTSVKEHTMHLDGRINAFARVQAAVARDPAAGLDLTELVADELLTYAALEGEQVRMVGPSVRLQPKAAEMLGLAIHELATNAAKYGALSVPHGCIRISWRVHNGTEVPRLVLEWKESGLANRAPKRKRWGFGTDLLERTLTYELKARTMQTYEPDGLRCTIELPLTKRIVISQLASTPELD